MNEKSMIFIDYLDERKQVVLDEISALQADGRIDESNILKAKSNIYDVIKSIFGALSKASDNPSFKDVFNTSFDKITTPWKESLEKAKKFDDSRKTMIEEAKLSAASEIIDKFNELF